MELAEEALSLEPKKKMRRRDHLLLDMTVGYTTKMEEVDERRMFADPFFERLFNFFTFVE